MPIKKIRVSKKDWFFSALDMLEIGGIDSIVIEHLAAKLHVSKSGFYWHFKNRCDLLTQILNYWTDEYTKVVTASSTLQAIDPLSRLDITTEMIWGKNLTKYDLAIRAWAKHDLLARKAVKKVDKLRTNFISSIFSELGFKGGELEMRTRLYVCYQSMERPLFGALKKEKWEKLKKLRLELLTRK